MCIRDRLESAPDENREFYILERFRYVTKVRVYLQQGKYEAAYNLLQQLLYYAKEMERTYIRIESTLLLAVTCYKMDRKEWKNLLQEAVSEAESYHFVRILTKEAGLWLPLLKKSREEIHWTDPHFHRQVLEEGKRMAQMYPGSVSYTHLVDILALSARMERMVSLGLCSRILI